MARSIGVSPGLVSHIELGTVTPSVGTLYNMASQLGIVLDDLFVSNPPARDSGCLMVHKSAGLDTRLWT